VENRIERGRFRRQCTSQFRSHWLKQVLRLVKSCNKKCRWGHSIP